LLWVVEEADLGTAAAALEEGLVTVVPVADNPTRIAQERAVLDFSPLQPAVVLETMVEMVRHTPEAPKEVAVAVVVLAHQAKTVQVMLMQEMVGLEEFPRLLVKR
jgi:hypothetical protein